MPRSRSPRPRAHIISVAEGRNETIRRVSTILTRPTNQNRRRHRHHQTRFWAHPPPIHFIRPATSRRTNRRITLQDYFNTGPPKTDLQKLPLPVGVEVRRTLGKKRFIDQPPDDRQFKPG